MATVDHRHITDRWQDCSLCWSHELSRQVLAKAQKRQVHWPQAIQVDAPITEDSCNFTSLDDAFANILYYLSATSRQCKRHYACSAKHCRTEADKRHCGRFHTAQATRAQRKHPLETQEAVHVQVVPGAYAVTAGGWEGGHQTHMVNLQPGHTVELDFCV